MKKTLILIWLLLLANISVMAQGVSPEEIIKRFSEAETAFLQEWQKYTYTQNISFQELAISGRLIAQRDVQVEVFFTVDGVRDHRVIYDGGRLRSISVSPEDLSDAISLQPFVLTSKDIDEYNIVYLGREPVDELITYVFEVEPKKIRKGERYFKGQIFVDHEDYQIVMTKGRIVPDYRNNKFPAFETIRQQVDGVNWFPVWTEADDILKFGRREQRVRTLITFEDFKKFEVDTSITYAGEEEPPAPPPAKPPIPEH